MCGCCVKKHQLTVCVIPLFGPHLSPYDCYLFFFFDDPSSNKDNVTCLSLNCQMSQCMTRPAKDHCDIQRLQSTCTSTWNGQIFNLSLFQQPIVCISDYATWIRRLTRVFNGRARLFVSFCHALAHISAGNGFSEAIPLFVVFVHYTDTFTVHL